MNNILIGKSSDLKASFVISPFGTNFLDKETHWLLTRGIIPQIKYILLILFLSISFRALVKLIGISIEHSNLI